MGNFIFPLLSSYKTIRAFTCDFSRRAVEFVKDRAIKESFDDRLTAFCADLTTDDWLSNIGTVKCQISTLIFVLSAIHPTKFVDTLTNVGKALNDGGIILFRDYGINDHAMIRFKPGSKVR